MRIGAKVRRLSQFERRRRRRWVGSWRLVGRMFRNSRVAQWKRAGPITQRSVDRNHALLMFLLNYHQKIKDKDKDKKDKDKR